MAVPTSRGSNVSALLRQAGARQDNPEAFQRVLGQLATADRSPIAPDIHPVAVVLAAVAVDMSSDKPACTITRGARNALPDGTRRAYATFLLYNDGHLRLNQASIGIEEAAHQADILAAYSKRDGATRSLPVKSLLSEADESLIDRYRAAMTQRDRALAEDTMSEKKAPVPGKPDPEGWAAAFERVSERYQDTSLLPSWKRSRKTATDEPTPSRAPATSTGAPEEKRRAPPPPPPGKPVRGGLAQSLADEAAKAGMSSLKPSWDRSSTTPESRETGIASSPTASNAAPADADVQPAGGEAAEAAGGASTTQSAPRGLQPPRIGIPRAPVPKGAPPPPPPPPRSRQPASPPPSSSQDTERTPRAADETGKTGSVLVRRGRPASQQAANAPQRPSVLSARPASAKPQVDVREIEDQIFNTVVSTVFAVSDNQDIVSQRAVDLYSAMTRVAHDFTALSTVSEASRLGLVARYVFEDRAYDPSVPFDFDERVSALREIDQHVATGAERHQVHLFLAAAGLQGRLYDMNWLANMSLWGNAPTKPRVFLPETSAAHIAEKAVARLVPLARSQADAHLAETTPAEGAGRFAHANDVPESAAYRFGNTLQAMCRALGPKQRVVANFVAQKAAERPDVDLFGRQRAYFQDPAKAAAAEDNILKRLDPEGVASALFDKARTTVEARRAAGFDTRHTAKVA